MIGSMLILVATMIGQAPPGADGPAPSPSRVKQWITTTAPDGTPIRILGWMDGGKVQFDPAEYPQFATAKPTPAPTLTLAATATAERNKIPTGVVQEKLPHVRPGAAWYGGNTPHPVGDSGRNTTPAKKPEVYLTVIGSEPERSKFLASLERDSDYRDLAGRMGERLAVNEYDPSNPMASGVGLPAGGRPDVVVQDSGGAEIFRRPYDPGPKMVIAAIRKADPSYRPGLGDPVSTVPEWTLLAIGGVAAFAIYVALSNRKAVASS